MFGESQLRKVQQTQGLLNRGIWNLGSNSKFYIPKEIKEWYTSSDINMLNISYMNYCQIEGPIHFMQKLFNKEKK